MHAADHQARLSPPLSTRALGRSVTIQLSALAGFRHHCAPQVWTALHGQDLLSLAREEQNPYDPDAVALYWRGYKLGYLPKGENFLVARLLDADRSHSARVRRLEPNAPHNPRIRVAVLLH